MAGAADSTAGAAVFMVVAAVSTAVVVFMEAAGEDSAGDAGLAAGEHLVAAGDLVAAFAEGGVLADAVDSGGRMAAGCNAAAVGDSADTRRADIADMGARDLAHAHLAAGLAPDRAEVTARGAELATRDGIPMRERRLQMGDGIRLAEADRDRSERVVWAEFVIPLRMGDGMGLEGVA